MTAEQLKEIFNTEFTQEQYDTYRKIDVLFRMRDFDDRLSYEGKSLNDFDAETIKAMLEEYEHFFDYSYGMEECIDDIIRRYAK